MTFNKNLNKYLACFTSPPHVFNYRKNKIENTHNFLLKIYEILASGSLLVLPQTEKDYIKEIYLEDRVNCFLIDLDVSDDNIIKQINSLLINNEINKIRKNGQILAKNKLNSKIKHTEIKNIIMNFCNN